MTLCLSSGSTYTEDMVREHLMGSRVGFSAEVADGLIDRWYEMVGKAGSKKGSAPGIMTKDQARVELKKLLAPGSAYWSLASPADRARILGAGFDAHLGKPFTYVELSRAFIAVMRRRREVLVRQLGRLRAFAKEERRKARELRQQVE